MTRHAFGAHGPRQPAGVAGNPIATMQEAVGRDAAGRVVIQAAVERRDLEALMTFGAVEVESEDGGDDEPYEVTPMSPCWAWEAGRVFTGIPLQ